MLKFTAALVLLASCTYGDYCDDLRPFNARMREKYVACPVTIPATTDRDVAECRDRMRSCTKEDRAVLRDYVRCMDAQPVCTSASFYSDGTGCAAKLSALTTTCTSYRADPDPATPTPVSPTTDPTTDPVEPTYDAFDSPVAEIAPMAYAYVGYKARVDGSKSRTQYGDQDTLTFAWRLISQPAGSTSVMSDATATPSFTPDKEGLYEIGLTVSTRKHRSNEVSIVVNAIRVSATARALPYRVVDAEISSALDRLIVVSSNALHIVDARTDADTSVAMPVTASSVSVSPDGHFAAVGHDGWISYVDLVQAKVVSTQAIPIDVGDVALAANGYVYATPRDGQWQNVHALRLVDGVVSKSAESIYADARIKVQPGGAALYGADRGLSPSDIERYDIDMGTPKYVSDSPYHGDHEPCGDLWFSDDGKRIFTACGNVFRASQIKDEDMTYNGALPLPQYGRFSWIDHDGTQVAAIRSARINSWDPEPPTDVDMRVTLYGYEFLAEQKSTPLLPLVVGDEAKSLHGRFVFFAPQSPHVYVLAKLAAEDGAVNDWAIMALDR